MPLYQVPAIDQAASSGWSEQDINKYNALPFFLEKMALKYRAKYGIWSKFVGKIPWSANMGPIMKRVSKEPSPVQRQFAFPNEISQIPMKDVIGVRERTVTAFVRRHRFESQNMNFVPSFRDFLTDHVAFTSKDINEKMLRFEDVFIRGHIFHQSPYVFIPNAAGGELVDAPMGDGNPQGTTGKSTAWLQSILPTIGNPGNLSLNAINLAATILENDLRIAPFSGGSSSAPENQGVSDMYCQTLSSEAWNQFIYDPWLKENKSIDLNIVTDGFKGKLFGRVTCKIEDLPLRIAADGTFPEPETIQLNPDAFNYGESIPNPAYVNAPFEVGFLNGAQGYQSIEVGAPPKDFAGNGMPNGFGKMIWNGEIGITKNILLPVLVDGLPSFETNMYGEYLRLFAQATYGIVGEQKRSSIPMIFKRKRGAQAELAI